MNRIIFLIFTSLVLLGCTTEQNDDKSIESETSIQMETKLFFKLSLAEWSFHRALYDGKMDNLDFAARAAELGFEGIEYVNGFFKDKAQDTAYLDELNKRAKENGIVQLLIMVDGEGHLGATDEIERTSAVEAHYKWVDAAQYLECHSIRVNAAGEGTAEEVADAAVDGLSRLSKYAAEKGINVIVENHGGYSSDGFWLNDVISRVDVPNCGTLPDFGNFCMEWDENDKCAAEFNRYKGVELLMPFAKAVSAKSYNFDEEGSETKIDYFKMLKLVKDEGYKGYIGVEFEGDIDEQEGIIKTKELLIKAGKELLE